MKFGQIAILALAVFAVAAIAVAGRGAGDSDDDKSASTPPTAAVEKAPAGAVEVHFAYSPEKEPLLKAQIKAFNGSGAQVGGKPVFVRAEIVSSGDAEARIADGSFKPVAWSPVVEPVGAAAELRGRPRAGAARRTRRSPARRW